MASKVMILVRCSCGTRFETPTRRRRFCEPCHQKIVRRWAAELIDVDLGLAVKLARLSADLGGARL
jgi:hypothetical protein